MRSFFLNCFWVLCSELGRSFKNSARTGNRWKWNGSSQAKIFLLRSKYRFQGSGTVESAVRSSKRRHFGWNASCYTRQSLRICWNPVPNSVWWSCWIQTPSWISWVSLVMYNQSNKCMYSLDNEIFSLPQYSLGRMHILKKIDNLKNHGLIIWLLRHMFKCSTWIWIFVPFNLYSDIVCNTIEEKNKVPSTLL